MKRDIPSMKLHDVIALWQGWKRRYITIGLGVLAICLRSVLFGIHTSDYAAFSGWYDFIQSHGGFAALKYNFSNYNVSYFYLLTLTTYIPIPKMISIKLVPVCFDLLMALFVYLIVRLKYKNHTCQPWRHWSYYLLQRW